jgi:hypothetical protein
VFGEGAGGGFGGAWGVVWGCFCAGGLRGVGVGVLGVRGMCFAMLFEWECGRLSSLFSFHPSLLTMAYEPFSVFS